eukprot:1786342-Pyramimonas_sp.AAC.1
MRTLRWSSDWPPKPEQEEAKRCIANEMTKNYQWATYTGLERALTLFKHSRKTPINANDPDSKSVWDDMEDLFKATVDGPQLQSN